MTIRLRSISGDEVRLRPNLPIFPPVYDGGLGPYNATSNTGGMPVPTEPLYDRADTLILDRAGDTIETRT